MRINIRSGSRKTTDGQHLIQTDLIRAIRETPEIIELSKKIQRFWEEGNTTKAMQSQELMALRLRFKTEHCMVRPGFSFKGVDSLTLHSLLSG